MTGNEDEHRQARNKLRATFICTSVWWALLFSPPVWWTFSWHWCLLPAPQQLGTMLSSTRGQTKLFRNHAISKGEKKIQTRQNALVSYQVRSLSHCVPSLFKSSLSCLLKLPTRFLSKSSYYCYYCCYFYCYYMWIAHVTHSLGLVGAAALYAFIFRTTALPYGKSC